MPPDDVKWVAIYVTCGFDGEDRYDFVEGFFTFDEARDLEDDYEGEGYVVIAPFVERS